MENLIGRKCKGFKFENSTTYFQPYMSKYIKQIGVITRITDTKNVEITFQDGGYYYYPLSEIHKHLIPLEDEIPTLGEGKLMLVSDDEVSWKEYYVIAKTKHNIYISYSKLSKKVINWNFAKEIETEKIVELTLKDISEGKGVGVKPSLIRIKE